MSQQSTNEHMQIHRKFRHFLGGHRVRGHQTELPNFTVLRELAKDHMQVHAKFAKWIAVQKPASERMELPNFIILRECSQGHCTRQDRTRSMAADGTGSLRG